jgi:hypothetical protein
LHAKKSEVLLKLSIQAIIGLANSME